MRNERTAPVLPVPTAEAVPQPEVEPGELEALLTAHTRHLNLLDVKALGFVGFLERAGKQQAVDLLVQSGATADAARNALERLALAGLIRDTGHNYLAIKSELLEKAVQQAEAEMIELTGFGG
jgi:hypothetical protein